MKRHILRTWDLVFLALLAMMLFVGGFLLGRSGGTDGPPLTESLFHTEQPAAQETAPLLAPLADPGPTLPPP